MSDDKSLIYSLFSKFIDNRDEEETEDGSYRSGGQEERSYRSDAEKDHRVETVEDWNEQEQIRRRKAEAALLDDGLHGRGGSPEQEDDGQGGGKSAASQGAEGSLSGAGQGADGGRSAAGQGTEGSRYAADDEDIYCDASVEVTVADDKMSASIMIYEPMGDGEPISREEILEALLDKNVVHGIDEEKIGEIVKEQSCRQMFVVAKGTQPIDGQDGRIKDYFPRKAQIKYATKDNGGIDFKSMNLIHNVKKGEVVCEITMPTDAKDGKDVFGNPVHGRKGTMPPVPQGKNIVYSPERDRLLTACEGNLTFRSGRFSVENVFTVSGNVDNSVGNIDFTGSVTVHGDVFEGFCVKARGDITVMGIVEGATLKAGGNIQLYKGMRGMRTGVLEAEGDITAKFLEDCTIYAKNNIQAEYIINSEVSCGNDLTLVGRRGAFIGGNCFVYNCMSVKTVGASSHVSTYITMGVTPQLVDEMEEVARGIAEITKKQEEYGKDISFLNTKLKSGTITPRQQERLVKLKLEAPVNALKEKKLKKQAEALSRKLKEVGRARLKAGEVHPGTVICIGDCKLSISKKEESCSFYYADGGIRKGIR